MGEVWTETGYNNQKSHNLPSGGVSISPTYHRRNRHDIYRNTIPLPDHLTRIEFIKGEHRGKSYVYAGVLAEALIRQGKAELSVNQMESAPLREKEVMQIIKELRGKRL